MSACGRLFRTCKPQTVGLPIIPANEVNLINILDELTRSNRFIGKNGPTGSILFHKS
jgi:hypothetical protein